MIYKLDPVTLEKTDVIEEYESCVWTERFIEAGDCNIVVPASHENAVLLRPRSLVLHEDSEEPMHIDTREYKEGKITAVGRTLETFFNERALADIVTGPLGDREETPQGILWAMLESVQHNFTEQAPVHPRLRFADYVESVDPAYPSEFVNFKFTEEHPRAYDWAIEIARKYVVGMRIKRQYNTDDKRWELVFVMRRPEDRSDHDWRQIVLSSENDNFANVHEVYSVADQVDVIVVYPPKSWVAHGLSPVFYPNEDFRADENPFNWRMREYDSEDITVKLLKQRLTEFFAPRGDYSTDVWDDLTTAQQEELLLKVMRWKARETWAELQRKPRIAIDGEIINEVMVFGQDYHMGDIVQVEGDYTGGKRRAMITEYIRSFDGSGGKSYPTLAEPLVPESGEVHWYGEGDGASGGATT